LVTGSSFHSRTRGITGRVRILEVRVESLTRRIVARPLSGVEEEEDWKKGEKALRNRCP